MSKQTVEPTNDDARQAEAARIAKAEQAYSG